MAKTINTGYLDTAIPGGPATLDFPRGKLNFASDFRIKTNTSGKEIVLTNITSPIDRPENIRLAYTDIGNVYTGSGVDPSVSAPTKRGVSVLAQITEIQSVTDSVDPDYRIDLPLSCHLVIKVPANENVNAAMVRVMIGRLLSSLFDSGSTTDSRLDAILRGSLISKEV